MITPRTFHFVFGLLQQKEPFELAHYLCLRSCLEVNRPDAIVFHFRNEPWGPLWERIRPHLHLRRLEDRKEIDSSAYAKGSMAATFRYAHESDFIRLEILAREGGVYADMDTLFIRPIPEDLFNKSAVMGHEKVDTSVPAAAIGGSLCNAFIMAEAGSSFIRRWQERITDSFDGSWSQHSTFLPFQLSCEYPDEIHVEPESSFFYLDWSRQGIDRLFRRDVPLPETAYSLHLWAHLWWSRSRRDVSRFHAGCLTPAYVRHARSTYARLAAPFLPEDTMEATRWRFMRERVLDTVRVATDPFLPNRPSGASTT